MAPFLGQNKVYGYHTNLIAKYIVIIRDDFQLLVTCVYNSTVLYGIRFKSYKTEQPVF